MFDGFFNSLNGASFVFGVIGAIAGALLLLQVALTMFGFGFEGDTGFESGGDDGWSSGLFSIRSMVAFFFAFGWTGLIMKGAGANTFLSVLMATAAGLVLFAGVGLLWKQFSKLNESGNVDYASAVGSVGTVYLSIPDNRSGAGKIEVAVQGRMRVVDALTEATDPIAPGARVKVVDTIDAHTLLVASD